MQPKGGPRLLITEREAALYLERAFIHVEGGRIVYHIADDEHRREDASPIPREEEACPLRDIEARLRKAMLAAGEKNVPLSKYLSSNPAQTNTRFIETRRFRSSTRANLPYAIAGEDLSNCSRPLFNLTDKRRKDDWRTPDYLHEWKPVSPDQASFLFTNILERV